MSLLCCNSWGNNKHRSGWAGSNIIYSGSAKCTSLIVDEWKSYGSSAKGCARLLGCGPLCCILATRKGECKLVWPPDRCGRRRTRGKSWFNSALIQSQGQILETLLAKPWAQYVVSHNITLCMYFPIQVSFAMHFKRWFNVSSTKLSFNNSHGRQKS